MYIKQVVIEGFKSYGEQIAIEPFSPKINCVVGANGSGKTNFFHAIQFVLSDIFQNLRSEDRHALLHEGAGHQVLSAFVEIVFDNSDNRIPVDKEEVRLRRMIGLKEDEYLLDGKHVKKTEVMNLLEIAGFPRSNPYYVVQQGKIASLTLMKDSERLDLVKEICGTRVYEKTRCECLKLMQETGNVKKKVIQVHQCMDKILKELDEKNEELRKYQQLDKQRKSLEYTIYDKELQDAWQKLVETETRKAELVTGLTTNLKRRKHELEARISSAETETSLSEAKLKRQELDDAKLLIDDATEQLKRVTERIDELTKQLRTKKEEKNKLKTSEDECERKLQDEAKELEQLLSKRNVFLSKQEEYSKKIRELGSLPSDAFEMGEGSMKELLKTLHRCNEQLLQFSHVNKKALDLYVNFTMQREEFQKGQAEVDAVEEKIREWISFSDRRKDEETERTFEGIARHFREVFSELVQGGHGDLIMIKNGGDQGDDDLDEDEPQEANLKGRVEKYIGVKVKVSFTGQGETQSMKQLSGGQKTLVALALIFAIQRYDPRPVCLFDEMDAALDPQYRAAVGNMIHHLADMSNTQFITTTFRPEFVKIADKIYGVAHKNGVSRVNVISKEVALDFIEHDPSHIAC